MRVLIWCDAYYQLISAINMRTAIFANCEVDVVVSDHSSDAERVVERLRAAGVFDSAIFAQTKKVVYGGHKKSKLSLILRSAFGKTPSLSCEAYDEIVFYGLNPWLYGIGDESARKGKNVRWSRFDEGILSYDTDFAVGRIDGLLAPLRRMSGKYAITDSVDRYYCYFWNESLRNLSSLRQYDDEYLIMGDFNSTWDHSRYRKMLGDTLVDASQQAGEGFHMTYPSEPDYAMLPVPPMIEIDHIVYSKNSGMSVGSLQTVNVSGADHLALLGTWTVS